MDVNRLLRIVPAPHAAPAAEAEAEADAEDPDDRRLVDGLRAGEPWAADALVDRYGGMVRRVLIRVLGAGDSEQADLVQEVLTRAWQGVGQLSQVRSLRPWLMRIAVFTARGAIRRRRRRRWLAFFATVPEPEPTWAGPEMQEAARCVYRIFDRLPVDQRLPFALRVLGGLDLEETADACGMSVATVRRRLAKAERRFFELARQCEALAPWIEASS